MGLADAHTSLIQLAATAACVAFINETIAAPPQAIAENKIRFFTICSHCHTGGSASGLSAIGARFAATDDEAPCTLIEQLANQLIYPRDVRAMATERAA
jgi:hypothetical protein